MITSSPVLLKTRYVLEKKSCCRESKKTHILCSIFILENHTVCGIMFKHVLYRQTDRQATDENTIRLMRFTCGISKATNTH